MSVLLNILIETLLLMAFLWIGKSVMKAQLHPKTLVVTALAGACASQVLFVGLYLSFAVVLFFMWKMARVDIVPDGALIIIIGKGVSFIAMIWVVGAIWDQTGSGDLAGLVEEMPIYEDGDGISYFAEGEKVYYRNVDEEKVYVDANVLFGISEVVSDSAEGDKAASAEGSDLAPDELEEIAAVQSNDPLNVDSAPGFSEPYLSDSMVRGEPVPFLLFVPQGWMVKKEKGSVALRIDDHTFIHCFSNDAISNNKTHLRNEVNRVLSQYSGYEVARQEIVTMDKKQWARVQFVNQRGDQVLILTHGGNRGSYTVELNGSFKQLSAQKSVLNRVITSFKFPASTYFVAKVEAEEEL